MALEPAKLSDFVLFGTLGTGTTAKVYQAVQAATGRPVAIKVMANADSDAEVRERFAREALLLAGVSSRHVAKILGYGFERGQPFLVLELLRGETLDAKLRRDGPVPPSLALHWIEQLIVGIRDCHDAKVIHRDIKPANIFLDRDGALESVKLIDFGVARLREIAGDSHGITSTHHVIGSMGYMAPEQFRAAKSVGFPADLYAIGVVVFRALSGRLPFVSRSLDAIIRMKTEQAPPPIAAIAPELNQPALDAFVSKALMRDPAHRFQSAREMLDGWWLVMESFEEATVTGLPRSLVLDPALDRGAEETGGQAFASEGDETRVATAPPLTHPLAEDPTDTGRLAIDPAAISFDDERTPRPMAAPVTEPQGGEGAHPVPSITVERRVAAAVDEYDQPTRSDPELHQLVQRELELQRQRARRQS